MQQLARKFEAELTFDFGTVIGKMENSHPTPLSLMQEMAVDGHSFAAAYVDYQSRLLRPAWVKIKPSSRARLLASGQKNLGNCNDVSSSVCRHL